MNEEQKQWNEAIENLKSLAAERRQLSYSPWANPDAIDTLRTETVQEIAHDHQDEPDSAKELMVANMLYQKLYGLFSQETDEVVASGGIHDEASSYALLMLRFEELFIATAAFSQAEINRLTKLMQEQDSAISDESMKLSEQCNALSDALAAIATEFTKALTNMRRNHDSIFGYTYGIKLKA
ncbi:MAG TPA: hypothetical protein VN031_03880 [Candidatus Microsaccharimonas sp.]|nr:hypothetical protein [Candidatus Microsaccharimonas sp.]